MSLDLTKNLTLVSLCNRLDHKQVELAAAHAEIANLKAENATLKARETRRKQLRKLVISNSRTPQ